MRPPPTNVLVDRYLEAKRLVISRGFGREVDWQAGCRIEAMTEHVFLQEAAWVVVSAGLSERAARKCFPGISRAFLSWGSAKRIEREIDTCMRNALATFGNARKIRAIARIVGIVAHDGFEEIRRSLRAGDLAGLERLPYMGPATSRHLAKNLGLDVAKPDRHLTRIATAVGAASPQALCTAVSAVVGDRVAVVDFVFWRFATIERDYIRYFSQETTASRSTP